MTVMSNVSHVSHVKMSHLSHVSRDTVRLLLFNILNVIGLRLTALGAFILLLGNPHSQGVPIQQPFSRKQGFPPKKRGPMCTFASAEAEQIKALYAVQSGV